MPGLTPHETPSPAWAPRPFPAASPGRRRIPTLTALTQTPAKATGSPQKATLAGRAEGVNSGVRGGRPRPTAEGRRDGEWAPQ